MQILIDKDQLRGSPTDCLYTSNAFNNYNELNIKVGLRRLHIYNPNYVPIKE